MVFGLSGMLLLFLGVENKNCLNSGNNVLDVNISWFFGDKLVDNFFVVLM